MKSEFKYYFNIFKEFTFLIFNRLKALIRNPNINELKFSRDLIWHYMQNSIIKDKKAFLIFIGILCFKLFCLILIFDLITYSSIDKALNTQHSAAAERMIKARLFFLRNNAGLKLRLAKAYTDTGKTDEALVLIKQVQKNKNYSDKYFEDTVVALSENLKRKNKAKDSIEILEYMPLKFKNAKCQLIKVYMIVGRQELINENIEKANKLFLEAYELAGKIKLDSETLCRTGYDFEDIKRNLANTYIIKAEKLIKENSKNKDKDKEEFNNELIELYKKALNLSQNGEIYLKLAQTYKNKDELSLEEIKECLRAYKSAYTEGRNEAFIEYKQMFNLLKTTLKKENKEMSEEESKEFPESL